MRTGSWRGEKLAFHPGAIDGYAARISILPDRLAGVIVLSNLSGITRVAQIVSQIALDCLVGAPITDWTSRLGERRPAAAKKPDPPAAVVVDRPRTAYAGVYRHPAYGTFQISVAVGHQTLAGDFHGRNIVLDYAGKDSWRLRETEWPLREGLIFRFLELDDGKFQSFATPLADGPTYRHNAGPMVFKRVDLP